MLTVKSGWLVGHAIRKARKPHRCDYWHGKNSGGWCKNTIQPGDFYVEGDGNPESENPWVCERYCLACAGDEARQSLKGSSQ